MCLTAGQARGPETSFYKLHWRIEWEKKGEQLAPESPVLIAPLNPRRSGPTQEPDLSPELRAACAPPGPAC